jgi:hypothetical protein
MEVRKWPVHQEKVEIFKPEVRERLTAGGHDIVFAVLIVPEFGSDPELLALHAPG